MEEGKHQGGKLTRREAIGLGARSLAAAAVGGALGAIARRASAPEVPAPPEALIVRGLAPANLETQAAHLTALYTPSCAFFVRTHDNPPVLDLDRWRLGITGGAHSLSLSLSDLRARPQHTVTAVLQCAGNGRGLFEPKVPGAQWERGACGQARWTGVRLVDLLADAGSGPEVAHVHLSGADRFPMPDTPAFRRSIPIERARHETSLVALEMNGEPLPALHGGPARLVLPGWAGMAWTKWLGSLALAREEEPGFYMQKGYRFPDPAAPGRTSPVGEMVVKSIIGRPRGGAVLRAGAQEVVGVAFSGMTTVTRVEVSLDGGASFEDASLEGPGEIGAWKVFRRRFRALRPGPITIVTRATDARGAVQPEKPLANPGGYLYNAADRVTCEVRL